MMNIVPLMFAYCAEMTIAYLFMTSLSVKKLSFWGCILFGGGLFGVAMVANILSKSNLVLNLLTSLLAHYFLFRLCFYEERRNCLFYSVILCTDFTALDIITVLVTAVFTQSDPEYFRTDFFLFVLNSSISKTLYFITVLFLEKIFYPAHGKKSVPLHIILFATVIFFCFTALYKVCSMESISPKGQSLIAMIVMAIFIALFMLVLANQHQIEKEEEFTEAQNELRRLQIEKSYYDILDQQNQQLMLYAHDAKKHLSVIRTLNPDPQIGEYVSQLSSELENYTRNCHSGNMLLDVMLNKYTIECQAKRIQFEYNVRVNNLKELEQIDLVAILGNLMDNAVATAEKSEEKKISLETRTQNGYSVLILDNSCDCPPRMVGSQLITSKRDAWHHGFGIKSVEKSLKKYGGDFHWNYCEEKRIFTATAIIISSQGPE